MYGVNERVSMAGDILQGMPCSVKNATQSERKINGEQLEMVPERGLEPPRP